MVIQQASPQLLNLLAISFCLLCCMYVLNLILLIILFFRFIHLKNSASLDTTSGVYTLFIDYLSKVDSRLVLENSSLFFIAVFVSFSERVGFIDWPLLFLLLLDCSKLLMSLLYSSVYFVANEGLNFPFLQATLYNFSH